MALSLLAFASTAGASTSGAVNPRHTASATKAPYVIGFTSDFTSLFGYLGLGLKAGLLAYWNQVNKTGGINGHPINLIALDDDSQVNRGVANVTQLVTQDNAIMIAGVMYSVICSAVQPVLAQHKVPEICGVVDSSSVHPVNPWVYATTTDQAAYAQPMLSEAEHLMARHKGKVKVAVIFSTGSAAINQWNTVLDNLIKKQGWDLVTTQIVPEDAVDMTSEVANVIAAKPDVMLLGAGNDAWVLAGERQLAAAGNPFPVVSYDTPSWTTVKALDNKDFYYVSALAYAPSHSSQPGLEAFIKNTAAEGVNPNAAYILRGYLQAVIITNALRRCGWPCSGQQLETALNHTDFSTGGLISGNVRLTPTDHEPVTSLAAYQWIAPSPAPTLVQGNLKVGNQ